MSYGVAAYADLPLYGLPVAVFDFETTGVDPRECKAVELAIVHCNLGQDNAEVVFEKRFNPGWHIPEGASSVHGIGDDDVKDLDCMSEHIDEILQLLDGRVLAAYNLPYDWTLMSVEIGSQYDAQFFGICGLVMSRSLDGLFGGHKLEKVCNSRGIDLDNAHSASADVLATARLIEALLGEVTQRHGERFPTLRDYWGWQRGEAMIQERGLRDWLRGKGECGDFWPWTDY